MGFLKTAPLDVSEQTCVEAEANRFARKERLEEAGGKLLFSAIGFLREMVPGASVSEEKLQKTREALLSSVEKDEKGGYSLRLRMPDESAFKALVEAMAAFIQ